VDKESVRQVKRTERVVATAIIAIGAFAVTGALGVALPVAGIVAGAMIGLTVVFFTASSEPALIAVLSMPLLCLVQRLGGPIDLSVGDAALFVVFLVMAFLGPRPMSPILRAIIWLTVIYQATTVFTVIIHPYPANFVEWLHAWLLVAGAILVGWAAARRGYAPAALTLLILTAAAISLLSIGVAAGRFVTAGTLEEVYLYWPFFMHKNVIGTLAAFSAVVVYARPPWLRWPNWATTLMFIVMCGGMITSQSRQALISVVVAVVFIVLRSSSMSARSRAVLLPMFAAVVVAGLTVAAQFSEANKFNSVYQRLDWYAQSTDVWQMNPWFGMGLRWWYTGILAEEFQPPQAILEQLSSTGIVGLIGFVIMFGGFMMILWRRLPPEYGTLAVAMVLTRMVQGQLDQFWLTVQVSVPLIIVGICIGAYDHAAPDPGHKDNVAVVVLD